MFLLSLGTFCSSDGTALNRSQARVPAAPLMSASHSNRKPVAEIFERRVPSAMRHAPVLMIPAGYLGEILRRTNASGYLEAV